MDFKQSISNKNSCKRFALARGKRAQKKFAINAETTKTMNIQRTREKKKRARERKNCDQTDTPAMWTGMKIKKTQTNGSKRKSLFRVCEQGLDTEDVYFKFR